MQQGDRVQRRVAEAALGRQAVATGLNGLLIGVVLSGTVFQLFAMPFLMRSLGLRAAWFLFPIMLLQPLHWALFTRRSTPTCCPGVRQRSSGLGCSQLCIGCRLTRPGTVIWYITGFPVMPMIGRINITEAAHICRLGCGFGYVFSAAPI